MRNLYESILDSDEQITQNIKSTSIIHKIKDNLESCNDVKEFSKLWTVLDLDVNGFHWKYYRGTDCYMYVNSSTKFLMYCSKSMIVIYNDKALLWRNDKEFKDYCKKVADTLKMNTEFVKDNKKCILEFK